MDDRKLVDVFDIVNLSSNKNVSYERMDLCIYLLKWLLL